MLSKNVSHILVIPLFQIFQRLCISKKARMFKLHDVDLSPTSLSLMLVILPIPNLNHGHWLDCYSTSLETPLLGEAFSLARMSFLHITSWLTLLPLSLLHYPLLWAFSLKLQPWQWSNKMGQHLWPSDGKKNKYHMISCTWDTVWHMATWTPLPVLQLLSSSPKRNIVKAICKRPWDLGNLTSNLVPGKAKKNCF